MLSIHQVSRLCSSRNCLNSRNVQCLSSRRGFGGQIVSEKNFCPDWNCRPVSKKRSNCFDLDPSVQSPQPGLSKANQWFSDQDDQFKKKTEWCKIVIHRFMRNGFFSSNWLRAASAREPSPTTPSATARTWWIAWFCANPRYADHSAINYMSAHAEGTSFNIINIYI